MSEILSKEQMDRIVAEANQGGISGPDLQALINTCAGLEEKCAERDAYIAKLRGALEIYDEHGGIYASAALALSSADALAQIRQEAWKAALEEACGDICVHCKSGNTPTASSVLGGGWAETFYHHLGDGGYRLCDANAIRSAELRRMKGEASL